jgi:hypothetical protein
MESGAQGRITVLAYFNRISVFYSLLPIARTEWYRACDFTQSLQYCLNRDRNPYLIIVRYFSRSDEDKTAALNKLRDKYEKVVWFDDGAGAGCTSFEVLPFVDYYWKKALFRDRQQYMKALYGRQLYTDYYHRVFGVDDETPYYRQAITDQRDFGKLRIAWNNGAGAFPLAPLRQRVGVAISRVFGRLGLTGSFRWLAPERQFVDRAPVKERLVFARFGLANRPTIDHQRRMLARVLRSVTHFPVCVGRAPKEQYDREMASAAVTLSPFGWGEICFRDFEAILMQSALAKPDVEHIDTWPPVYEAGETYESLAWDGTDTVEKLTRLIEDTDRQRYLSSNALEAFAAARRDIDRQVGDRFAEILY